MFISEERLHNWGQKHNLKCPICKDSILFFSLNCTIWYKETTEDPFGNEGTKGKPAIRGKCDNCGLVLFFDYDTVSHG